MPTRAWRRYAGLLFQAPASPVHNECELIRPQPGFFLLGCGASVWDRPTHIRAGSHGWTTLNTHLQHCTACACKAPWCQYAHARQCPSMTLTSAGGGRGDKISAANVRRSSRGITRLAVHGPPPRRGSELCTVGVNALTSSRQRRAAAHLPGGRTAAAQAASAGPTNDDLRLTARLPPRARAVMDCPWKWVLWSEVPVVRSRRRGCSLALSFAWNGQCAQEICRAPPLRRIGGRRTRNWTSSRGLRFSFGAPPVRSSRESRRRSLVWWKSARVSAQSLSPFANMAGL